MRPYFETTTGQRLTDGLKVLLQVSVEFHELYGFSLNVRNIDPTYTLGDQARKRREIIQRLTDEGVLTMNRELELPMVPQKIAIISSPSAAGYEDFMQQLTANSRGLHFYTYLFPAVMQGNMAEQSIVNALDRIYRYEQFFDLVVIIRGGGSQVDLSCFDNYKVAYHITQFPLPVLTGIGHEKDDSIVDLVAHTRLKTPTAVAEFILEGVANFEERIQQLQQQGLALVETLLEEKKDYLEELARELSSLVRNQLASNRSDLIQLTWKFQQEIKLSLRGKRHHLDRKWQRLEHLTDHFFFVGNQKVLHAAKAMSDLVSRGMVVKRQRLRDYLDKSRILYARQLAGERHRLEMAGQTAIMSDPENILKKGFSITTFKGRRIQDPEILKRGDTIKTYMAEGSILSEVIEINQRDKNDN
jgi:exodeoxyribonuclease VII large subunit